MMKRIIPFILFIILCTTSVSANSSVIISQILYDTPYNERVTAPPYSNGEFVELYNLENHDVDLSSWCLSGDGSTEQFYFPSATVIPSNGYIVVAYRHSRTPQFNLSELYGNAISLSVLYQNKLVLSNSGESIRLCDADGTTVDSIFYDGTSNKRKPDRLSADNQDSIPGYQCLSLQRTQVSLNGHGWAVANNAHWTTSLVRFSTIRPELVDYISESFYWTASSGLPAGENYVVSITPLDSCQRVSISNGTIAGQIGVRMAAGVAYYDDFGRPSFSVLNSASPNRSDLVVYTDYDNDHHASHEWLPLAASGFLPQSADDMQSAISEQYADPYAFQTTQRENHVGGRVLSVASPGTTYQSHPSSYTYDVCGEGVLRFVCSDQAVATVGHYPASSLRSVTHTDADGKSVTSIMDANNRKVAIIMGQNYITYYVYDDMNRLRYVLPPAVVSRLSDNQIVSDEEDFMKQYAYIYRYDRKGNLISKRVPGVDWQYLMYDAAGRVLTMQDGNQRVRGCRTYIAYDDYGRVTELKEVCDSTGAVKMLSHSSYDSYDALSLLLQDESDWLRYQSVDGYGQAILSPVGRQTLSTIYHLSDSGYTRSASYYDALGRVIQQRRISTDGQRSAHNVRYHLDGSKQAEQIVYMLSGKTITEEHTYVYDHVGRLLQDWCSIDKHAPILLRENIYDVHGNLAKTIRHDGADQINYDYDLRMLPTRIASSAFTEQLHYADSLPDLLTPCFNGAVSGTTVSYGDSLYRFAYSYDMQNRLSRSSRVVQDSLLLSEAFEYDAMGNILSLCRNDASGNPLDYLQYDYEGNQVLSITDQVSSRAQYDTKEYHDWSDNPQMERQYDANGNLLSDSDRGIVRIVYNLLNMPDSVIFADGSIIVNRYDAAGSKLSSDYLVSIHKELVQDAQSGIIFADTILDTKRSVYYGGLECHYLRHYPDTMVPVDFMLHFSDGYMQWTKDSLGDEQLSLYYYYQDHLGNVCAVWNATEDTIIQQTCYYASGLPMNVSSGMSAQPYLYNGKEYVEAHGYDIFDYGFRGYYAATGQFTSIDPLCERTPWQSPYVYANNNSICNIDWMGLSAHCINSGAYYRHINVTYQTVFRYTEINNDGTVKVHIDNDDNSVVFEGEVIGTEIEGEWYIKGMRSYFMYKGTPTKFYDYRGYWAVTHNTGIDTRVRRWLRAKHIDYYEDLLLDYLQPYYMELALLNPLLGAYNDIKIIVTGETIYSEKVDDSNTLDVWIDLAANLAFFSSEKVLMRAVKTIKSTQKLGSLLPTNPNEQNENIW